MMTTQHYLERAHERFGLNISEAVRLLERADERGKYAREMPSTEAAYMRAKKIAAGCDPVFYNNIIFMVSPEGNCITAYPAPEWFGKKQHFCGKEKVRNVRRYYRNYIGQ